MPVIECDCLCATRGRCVLVLGKQDPTAELGSQSSSGRSSFIQLKTALKRDTSLRGTSRIDPTG
jgi:hypothetical protein